MIVQPTNIASEMIVRRTNEVRGRRIFVTPENSAMKHLCYGRIILDPDMPRTAFETGNMEVGLVCLSGKCRVDLEGRHELARHQVARHQLARYDAIYIPRSSRVTVNTETSVDLAECSAEVEGNYPAQVVRYSDVERNGSLKFTTGGPSNKRTVSILLGKNIEAGRILAGVTTSEPGNWTSWPPHEHASMLEELYLYYDMPAPAFGVQLVYTNAVEPEVVAIVREGDVVLMPQGFHPNVAVPDHPINFVWMMAAHREVEDRQYGVVTVQPGFDKGESGLEASLK
jgi:5-deoxy-glucuronate isomerase